jgi:hypothetical protein
MLFLSLTCHTPSSALFLPLGLYLLPSHCPCKAQRGSRKGSVELSFQIALVTVATAGVRSMWRRASGNIIMHTCRFFSRFSESRIFSS